MQTNTYIYIYTLYCNTCLCEIWFSGVHTLCHWDQFIYKCCSSHSLALITRHITMNKIYLYDPRKPLSLSHFLRQHHITISKQFWSSNILNLNISWSTNKVCTLPWKTKCHRHQLNSQAGWNDTQASERKSSASKKERKKTNLYKYQS